MAKKQTAGRSRKTGDKEKPKSSSGKKTDARKAGTKKSDTKKSTSTRASAERSTRKSSGGSRSKTDGRAKLTKEITALLGKMDEPSLAFIKQQADVIVSAGEYEELRKKTMDALSSLEGKASAEYAPDSVAIDRRDDSFFNITVRGKRVFFNIDEMRALTKLCHAASESRDGAKRLLTWFRRERADFLNETGIQGTADPALGKLWETIITTYKVKA
ncbi:hypothetical protein [Salinispira pacifica]